jgi:hypothetical protein
MAVCDRHGHDDHLAHHNRVASRSAILRDGRRRSHRIGHWFKLAFPRRTILVYNTYQPDRFDKALARLEALHAAPVDVVYTSPLLRRLSHRTGPVIESPIDLAKFVPRRMREKGARSP